MIQDLLVCLDSSPSAPAVMAAAVDLALRFSATIHPLRVIALAQDAKPAAGEGGTHAILPHVTRAAVRELLDLAVDATEVLVEPPIVKVGDPAWRVIVDTAEELRVDVIVLGRRAYERDDRTLGTTAMNVTLHAARHVLVVWGDRGHVTGG